MSYEWSADTVRIVQPPVRVAFGDTLFFATIRGGNRYHANVTWWHDGQPVRYNEWTWQEIAAALNQNTALTVRQ